MKEVDLFKFKIGDFVDVMEGWEFPLHALCKIENRRRKLKGVGNEINYYNEYILIGVPGMHKEEDLRLTSSNEVEGYLAFQERMKN